MKWAAAALLTVVWMMAPSAAESPRTLDELVRQVHEQRVREKRHHGEREARFVAERDRQQERLGQAKARRDSALAHAEALKRRHEENETRLSELEDKRRERAGDLNELFAVVRQAAAQTRNVIEASLISAQLPGRTALLDGLATQREPPTIEDLERLWKLYLKEMNQANKVLRFDAPVITANGEEQRRRVTRVGTFTAVSQGNYLKYLPETGKLVELSRQPPVRLRTQAKDFAQTTQGIHPMAVDPSRGAILTLMVQAPNAMERIRQGGVIGYLILLLGAVGLIIIVHRYLALWITERKIRRQAQEPAPKENNPLGRLQRVILEHRYPSFDALALRLDEIVAEEASKLQRGMPTLVIFAALTPLLGLLGTVTGMIDTFQSITLFGTGDPKLMSGGISHALITTQLGLAVAIPIVLAHSFLNGRANRIIDLLDQQGAVLLSRYEARDHA